MLLKTTAVLLIGAILGFSQATITVSTSNNMPRPGDTVTWTYAISGAAPLAQLAAFQYDAAVTGAVESARTADPGLVAIGKTLTCNAVRCIVVGLTQGGSQAGIPNGAFAKSTTVIPANALPGTTISLHLSNIVAVLPGSDVTPLAAGPDVSITVIGQKEDLNSDGVVDAKDVLISITQVLAGTCIPGADQNGDGVCTIQDVQMVAMKAK